MKRTIALIIALFLFASSALALEYTLEPVGELDYQALYSESGSNMLSFYDYDTDSYGLIDAEGNVILEATYSSISDTCYGYLKVEAKQDDIHRCGLIDLTGNVMIPCEYAVVNVENEYWAVGFKVEATDDEDYDYSAIFGDENYKITEADVYYLPSGKFMALDRDAYGYVSANKDVINIQDKAGESITSYGAELTALGTPESIYSDEFVKKEYEVFMDDETWLYGIKDAAGNITVDAQYEFIYEESDGTYTVTDEDGRQGLIDKNGNILTAMMDCDFIEYSAYALTDVKNGSYMGRSYVNFGYVSFTKDSMVGFATADGDITVEPQYETENVEWYDGVALTFADDDGNISIAAADGTVTPLENGDGFYPVYAGLFWQGYTDDFDGYVVADWHGEMPFGETVNDICFLSDGGYIAVQAEEDAPYTVYKLTVTY